MNLRNAINRVLGAAKLTLVSVLICGGSVFGQSLPTATDCTTYEEAFELHLNPKAVNCTADFLKVTATGLPDLTSESSEDLPMVGIQSWIQRVAIPYDYHWRIPLSSDWLAEPVETSARGPIAVAVDGVPIFHYERRPDVSTSLDNYEQRNDTVVQGELDQCGGHSGQRGRLSLSLRPDLLDGQT